MRGAKAQTSPTFRSQAAGLMLAVLLLGGLVWLAMTMATPLLLLSAVTAATGLTLVGCLVLGIRQRPDDAAAAPSAAPSPVNDPSLLQEQNPNPVLHLAADGALLYANPASAELLPLLYPHNRQTAGRQWRGLVMEVLATGMRRDVQVAAGERIFDMICVPVPDGPCVTLYGTDVTARRTAERATAELADGLERQVAERTRALRDELIRHVELERQLVAAKEQAEAASRTKSEFLANMSHELRTPLNAVIGFSEMMAEQVFGPLGHAKYGGYARDIQASGQHLLNVINDILDMSKVEAGRMEVFLEPVPVPEAVQAAVRLVQGRMDQAGVRLRVDLEAEVPPIMADHKRLIQVLVNLLSNAAKFTPAGGSVAIRATRLTGGIGIEVSDTGIGMSEEELAIALQPFRQVDSGLARRQNGTGLGLPLSRSFVLLQGGSFSVTSRKNAGTTVSLTFPERARVAAE